MQLTMQFKLFNATTMHNSTEKCKQIQKIKKSRFKSKESDLNLKKSDFFRFLLKIMIFPTLMSIW